MPPKKSDLPVFFKKVSDESIDGRFFYQGHRMFCAPGTHEAVIEAVIKYLKRGSRVIDLGAGTGAFTLRLKEQGYQVSAAGIDPATFGVDDTPYILWNCCEDVPEQYWGVHDAVVAIEVVEHLENIFDFFRKVCCLLKPGGLAFITTPNIFEARSRLMFLTSGNFLLFQKELMERWGHIQIIPFWLLQYAAESANFTCLEMYGVGDIMENNARDWKREIVRLFIYIKKLTYRERFPGELSKMITLMVLRKGD
jgi:cyclopropane fatty-acyl-phospholipid synthase-like methyltransferase